MLQPSRSGPGPWVTGRRRSLTTMSSDPPRVLSLHLAPGRRLPVRSVPQAYAAAAHGFVGDRYENARHRQVTVQSAEELAEAASAWGAPIDAGSTRRNVTLSHGRVPTRPGDRIRIGELELEVVRVAAPCRILDDTVGPGAPAALRRRAGAVCRVLSGGTVRVGDLAELLPADRDVPA
jgi:MOSC domain-containing protein YiiM